MFGGEDVHGGKQGRRSGESETSERDAEAPELLGSSLQTLQVLSLPFFCLGPSNSSVFLVFYFGVCNFFFYINVHGYGLHDHLSVLGGHVKKNVCKPDSGGHFSVPM